jgi:hypothetical protein
MSSTPTIKRENVFFVLFLCFVLMGALGCAYTLKYTITSSIEPQTNAPVALKTFAVKSKVKRGRAEFSMERKLLGILSQNLLDSGWSTALEGDATYLFTVDFKRPYPLIYPEIAFTPYPGRGYDTEGDPKYYSGTRSDEYFITITADAQGVERQYVWSVAITTVSAATNLLELARFTVPKAISRFPESGHWELREKVLPRSESAPKRK